MTPAQKIDQYRVIPRLIIIGYSYLLWDTVQWFQALQDPSIQQAGLISVVVGVAAPIISFYLSSGTKWSDNDGA